MALALALTFVHNVDASPISTRYVNAVRTQAGLNALDASESLNKAAEAHVQYLQRYAPLTNSNAGSAHEERHGLPEFSGKFAADRAQFFAYPHSQVLENISLGNETIGDSVTDLMSAIYHRFAFLDYDISELGAAYADRRYVYNMGQADLSQACLARPEAAAMRAPRSCLHSVMSEAGYQTMCNTLPAAALFTPPFPIRCENQQLLRNDYMQGICKEPPAEAVLKGTGAYLDICGDGTKIRVDWFKRQCQSSDKRKIYEYNLKQYEICEPPIKVHAQWYESFCANLPKALQQTDSGRYFNVCRNGFRVKSEFYQALGAARLAKLPAAVVWPVDGARNIPPVFYDEDPHPTPDLPMTGYPISIEFNSAKVKTVSMMGFTLLQRVVRQAENGQETIDWQPIDQVRQIDQSSDINQKFSAYQFSWFPLKRLHWGGSYRYQIDALVDGVFQQYNGQFDTRGFDVPIYRVQGDSPTITVLENEFILYREPDVYDNFPFRDINVKFNSRSRVKADVIDANTVRMNVQSSRCSPVMLKTSLREELKINTCKKFNWKQLF